MPIFRQPGSVIFIDDEPDFLEMIELVLPKTWHMKLFTSPRACLLHFHEAIERRRRDLQKQQLIVEQWHQGLALIPQLLKYWSCDTDRYGHPDVLVVDYAMPAMNGLAILEQLSEWTGACILLSGQADERIAIEAFNRGLLEQFILKQTPNIARTVHETVKKLLELPNGTRDQIWRTTLSPVQQSILRQPDVAESLSKFSQDNWLEHVVIGDPFGIIGITSNGSPSWLQLETPSTLAALREVVSQSSAPTPVISGAESIRLGTHLTDIELQQSLGNVSASTLRPSFSIGKGDLLGAHFPLSTIPDGLTPSGGYAKWRMTQPERSILI